MVDVNAALTQIADLAKCPIYLVGGSVRNAMLKLKSKDCDLCGPLPAENLGLEPYYKIIPVNEKLGTAIITDGSLKFEYTPFRIENYAPGGAHTPLQAVLTDDIAKDAGRRDFTCNALYYEIKTKRVHDFFGGEADIRRREIRAVPPAFKVFSSDGLRVLRLVRFAAELNFTIDNETFFMARKNGRLLKDISAERIREEFNKILVADTAYGIPGAHYRGLKLLGQLNLWKYIMPPVDDMRGLEQNPKYHRYDVYEHTLQTVRFAPPPLRLAALMHDIGKPDSVKRKGNMHEHSAVGEAITRYRLGAGGLKYSNAVIDETARLVALHNYDLDGQTSDNKVKRFVAENIDVIDKLVTLIKADTLATGMVREAGRHRFEDVAEYIRANNVPTSVKDLNISGAEVIAAGVPNSETGAALKELLDYCIINEHLNNKEWLTAQAGKIGARFARANEE